MRRRQLLVALGAISGGSAALALTGATLSNVARPSASLRVNVEGSLIVEKGSNFPSDGTTNTISTGVGDISSVSFIHDDTNTEDVDVLAALSDSTTVTAVADSGKDGSLSLGLSLPFDQVPGSGGSTKTYKFPGLIKITNNTNSSEDVAIEFDNGAGGTVTSNDAHGFSSGGVVSEQGSTTDPKQLSYDEVAYAFQFFPSGKQDAISPPGSTTAGNTNQNADHTESISGQGDSADIDLHVRFTPAIGQTLRDYATHQNLITTGGHFSLVEDIFVGPTSISNVAQAGTPPSNTWDTSGGYKFEATASDGSTYTIHEFTGVGTSTMSITTAEESTLSAVAVGGGGGGGGSQGLNGPGSSGGGGGGLRYHKAIPVSDGDTITVTVGGGGAAGTPYRNGQAGGDSVIKVNGTEVLRAGGGGGGVSTTSSAFGGTGGGGTAFSTDVGGGNGGDGSDAVDNGPGSGGGGAGGYSGDGGDGTGQNGQGGGGGGGTAINSQAANVYSNGGGVGLAGQGTDGVGATEYRVATGGSGGETPTSTRGGLFGGGGGGTEDDTFANGIAGAQGAVRIILQKDYPNP